MAVYSKFNEQRPRRIWDGIHARSVNGERITMALVDLDPNVAVPEHHHSQEQLGFILQGELVFTIGGETRTLHAGDTYNIPADVVHSASAGPDGCVVTDVFAPVRDDWEKLADSEPAPSSWTSRGSGGGARPGLGQAVGTEI